MGRPRIQHEFIDGVEHKRCGRCDQWRTLDQFGRNKRNWDGLSGRCKPCMCTDNRARYAAEPEKYRRAKREYDAVNRDLVNQRAQERYWADPKHAAEIGQRSYERNAEKRREHARAQRATPEGKFRVAADNAKFRALNPDYHREYMPKWFAENQGYRSEREAVRRARKRGLPSEPYTVQQIIDRDGFVCWLRGCAIGATLAHGIRDWSIDHLVPLQVDYPDHPGDTFANVALACARCNSGKRNKILPEAIARYEANLAQAA